MSGIDSLGSLVSWKPHFVLRNSTEQIRESLNCVHYEDESLGHKKHMQTCRPPRTIPNISACQNGMVLFALLEAIHIYLQDTQIWRGGFFTRINSGQAADWNPSRVGFTVLSRKKKLKGSHSCIEIYGKYKRRHARGISTTAVKKVEETNLVRSQSMQEPW